MGVEGPLSRTWWRLVSTRLWSRAEVRLNTGRHEVSERDVLLLHQTWSVPPTALLLPAPNPSVDVSKTGDVHPMYENDGSNRKEDGLRVGGEVGPFE